MRSIFVSKCGFLFEIKMISNGAGGLQGRLVLKNLIFYGIIPL